MSQIQLYTIFPLKSIDRKEKIRNLQGVFLVNTLVRHSRTAGGFINSELRRGAPAGFARGRGRILSETEWYTAQDKKRCHVGACSTRSLYKEMLHVLAHSTNRTSQVFLYNGACSTRSLYKEMLHVLAHSTNRTSQVFLYNGESPLPYTPELYRSSAKDGKNLIRPLTKIKICAIICTIS